MYKTYGFRVEETDARVIRAAAGAANLTIAAYLREAALAVADRNGINVDTLKSFDFGGTPE